MNGLFVLADMAKVHYWTGRGFLRIEDGPYPVDDLACFCSRLDAETAVRNERLKGGHLQGPRIKLPLASLVR